MSEKPTEFSKSGQPIHRYEPRKIPFQPAFGDEQTIEQIDQHITKHLGPVATVWHEIISDLVHVDVHVVAPRPERNYYTLVTSGMSDSPMTTPPGCEGLEYAELMICLPPDWPLEQEQLQDDQNFWPLRALKFLARMPHEYDTWIWQGHTIPNGDPAEPFAKNTKFCCMLLLPPLLCPPEFQQLVINEQKTIHFFALIPMYLDEMNFKLNRGTDELIDKYDQIKLNELLNLNRPNVCKPWWKFWG